MESYQLIDSGNLEKLEQFGPFKLVRPCPQALWKPKQPEMWNQADAHFSRERGWRLKGKLPHEWVITVCGIQFKLKRTDFGHLGIFPEQAPFWEKLQNSNTKNVLNLFAYSGGSTLAAAKSGARVTHVDAAKGMVQWAGENAKLNNLEARWIVEDARKYLARACRREEKYDGIILDPPTFGRGKSGEVFKIEEDLPKMLQQCQELLSDKPCYLLLSCHTPGYTPIILKQLLQEVVTAPIEAGEMVLQNSYAVPSGAYAYATF